MQFLCLRRSTRNTGFRIWFGFFRCLLTLTIERVVTQLQQDVITSKAQVADPSGLAEAVRAINNLATAQVRNDTPSLIDVRGLGRTKEFTGHKKDFQQWSKKTEAFFAGVIKESEMMLEWAAEQPKSHNGGVALGWRNVGSLLLVPCCVVVDSCAWELTCGDARRFWKVRRHLASVFVGKTQEVHCSSFV